MRDKGKGPPITLSSFRPLCMLDNAGKVYNKLLRSRLRNEMDEAGGLAENQHGYRKQRLIIGAIQKVVETHMPRGRAPIEPARLMP